MKIQTRKVIDVQEWDVLVRDTYKKIYSFQQQDDCKDRGIETINTQWEKEDFENTELDYKVNGEEMGINFQTWMNTSPEDTQIHFKEKYENELFWERNFYPHVSMIAKDLVKRGLLEEGEYDININW